ncbi:MULTISPECIES: tRNA (adenosine(37)-N6)-threonylcarbamoyltransferase complex dimerization subunit type 1 TsaB [unclassified Lysobacter]|uniref:tRNA (adenosine(37)-N6)-threonylcarbamoyltransferase complex dimerization subunit type 1 TsaB n=1 Tax=unclassified Lysobacter TaxID=2635362 RepID=UPI001BE8771C|nr:MULTISPECIES: tRNA (adenosine(37)-N6)-threonylcarbamoyltransferase complex dimerization subunit type 1 TsaB [unclassified Lysobacter]MBT2745862.1 tRNA (adenosine(37)-N6)-threonylcarbamoyltransferase complex dimerization subunit type 1 TsaB [Lysobacter sp. ISL-42]MBT2749579.1 tRNA (adenosine(37)-N6)-threonylcarbamoyltransferase complex dimerization subunit type 1 TsaB [Lysobacter sp. ISL-50]MBT2778777.1 tRNA (adenosine(37)-N6)-threonylcarbamoyltransferase complex dimerization subunit type 1 Ts
MNLLAFETSTEACSVALWLDGEVRERYELAPRRHAELSLPWAEQLLDEAGLKRSQLDAIAIGRGPGAFTGVRLAISLAQGVALALDVPVIPISTLAVLALRAQPLITGTGPRRVLSAIDARMGEIYTAAYELRDGEPFALDREAVLAPDAAALPDLGDNAADNAWLGVGTGFAAADGALRQRLSARFAAIDPDALPHAADLARLAAAAYARGESVAPERIEPAYLRNNVALTIAEQVALRAKSR